MHAYEQLQLIGNLSLGLMFGISSVTKLGMPRRFIKGVAEYGLVPQPLVSTLAIAVIVAEAVLAVLHFTGRPVAALLGLSLLSIFVVAVTMTLRRQRVVACHCFGGSTGEMVSAKSLVRLGIAIVGESFLLVQASDWATPLYAQLPDISYVDVLLGLTWALFVILATMWGLSLPDLARLRPLRQPSSGTSSS